MRLFNIEKDRRAAPTEDVLERMAVSFTLTKRRKIEMLDLAAKSKNAPAVALDLPEYISERDIVRAALRTAKDVDASDEERLEFLRDFKNGLDVTTMAKK